MSTAVAILAVILFAAPPQAHFARAQKLFAQGKYRDALDEFTAAGEAAPAEVPALWFDIGQCHRNLGHARQAVASFRRYLALEPDAPDREQVLAMIVKLGGSVDEVKTSEPAPAAEEPSAPAPAPVVDAQPEPPPAKPVVAALFAPPPPPRAPPKPQRWKLWVGVATGVVAATAIAVGVGVGVGMRPAEMPAPAPMLGTPIVLDTRGH